MSHLLKKLDAAARRACVPIAAGIELGMRCNLRCQHCYNFDRSQNHAWDFDRDTLTPSELRCVVAELAELGTLSVCLSGGEVLVFSHLDDIVADIVGLGMRPILKTNGVGLRLKRVETLHRLGVREVQISVYGGSAPAHDGMTGVAGSFARTWDGICNAVEKGWHVQLTYCITQANTDGIPWAMAQAQALGCSLNIETHITARDDKTTSSRALRINKETLAQLYRGPLAAWLPQKEMAAKKGRGLRCGCARSTIGIAANGDVYPCLGAPMRAGNVREQALADVWAHSAVFARLRQLQDSDFKTCAPCSNKNYCRRSSGQMLRDTGDYTGAEPHVCREAQVRKEAVYSR